MLISNSLYKKLNINFSLICYKIFKNIKIKLNGLDIILYFQKNNILQYLYFLKKKNSNFLFNILTDIIVEDFSNEKKRFLIKYYLRSLNNTKILCITLKIKEYSLLYSINSLYKNSY